MNSQQLLHTLDSMSVNSDHQVTLDDQNNINEFSKLNWKLTKLEEQLEGKKEELSYLADSMNEVELCFDEHVICKIGDAFAFMKPEQATKHVSILHSRLSEQVHNIKEECNSVKGELSRLKVLLYGKFQDSIHLETE